MTTEMKENQMILWFNQILYEDLPLVGGKNSSLGEMYNELSSQDILVPDGFAITTKAYDYFLDYNNIRDKIDEEMNKLDIDKNLEEIGDKIRNLISKGKFPKDLKQAIMDSYKMLEDKYDQENIDVAVRSSATAEDLPTASFAGQQETFLNIRSGSLLESCKKCMASLYTNRAISYRNEMDLLKKNVKISIGVQKMVRSDKASSGVIFTLDTETGFKDIVLITGGWGLGDNIVQGSIDPDEWRIFKPTFKKGKKSIIEKRLGKKQFKMIYSERPGKPIKNIKSSESDKSTFCLTNSEVLKLSNWAMKIEEHYSLKNKKWTPMDIEWAKDGFTKEIFIVQSRPETIHSQRNQNKIAKYTLTEKGKVLLNGASIGTKICSGMVRIIKDAQSLNDFQNGEILVTNMTDPDWGPIMKKSIGIITNKGGRTCHAALVGREYGIPCIVGTTKATNKLKNGQIVTIDCATGEIGQVLDGEVPFTCEIIDFKILPKINTKLGLILSNPDSVFNFNLFPIDGVGLIRMEYIFINYIKAHPLALLHINKSPNNIKKELNELIKGYKNGREYFVHRLSEGIGKISAAFYPKKVIVRFSDFKTNEYAKLLGGEQYEPKEDNPMLGWRGASRYYDEKYKDGFKLECEAIKRVREKMGLDNLQVMVPFVRTIDEAKKVMEIIAKNGLKQHENGLEVMAMCEIPSNVILAEKFLDIFDGYSIGSNDLTQLVLGVDRDSEIVSKNFDERNEAVTKLIKDVIKIAKRKNKYIGICGQAPSDYPEFVEFLVNEGIDMISLNPDNIISTLLHISKIEKENESKVKKAENEENKEKGEVKKGEVKMEVDIEVKKAENEENKEKGEVKKGEVKMELDIEVKKAENEAKYWW